MGEEKKELRINITLVMEEGYRGDSLGSDILRTVEQLKGVKRVEHSDLSATRQVVMETVYRALSELKDRYSREG